MTKREHPWLALESVITVATMAMVSYLLSILFELPLVLILGLYLSATVSTLWMMIRIRPIKRSTNSFTRIVTISAAMARNEQRLMQKGELRMTNGE